MNKLHYSKNGQIIAGICAGIAETYNVNVSIIRFFFIVFSFIYGAGVIIYLALLLILPSENQTQDGDECKEVVFERRKKLYRTNKNRYIAGVCSGIADYFDIDVSLVRIIFIIVTLFSSGIPVLLYLALSFILPYRDQM